MKMMESVTNRRRETSERAWTCVHANPPAPACQGPSGCEAYGTSLQFTALSASMFHVPCCMLHFGCCIHPTGGRSVPWEQSFYPLLARVAGFWVPLRKPWNSLKFKGASNSPQNLQNVPWRTPKPPKWAWKWCPNPWNCGNNWKSEILWKSLFLLCFRGIGTLKDWWFSIPKSIRHLLETYITIVWLQNTNNIKK